MVAVLQGHVAQIRYLFHLAHKTAGADGPAKAQHLLCIRIDRDDTAPGSPLGDSKPLTGAKSSLPKTEDQLILCAGEQRLQLKPRTRSRSGSALRRDLVGHLHPALLIKNLHSKELIASGNLVEQGSGQQSLPVKLLQQSCVIQQPISEIAFYVVQGLGRIGQAFMGEGDQADRLNLQQTGKLLSCSSNFKKSVQGQQQAKDDRQADQQRQIDF